MKRGGRKAPPARRPASPRVLRGPRPRPAAKASRAPRAAGSESGVDVRERARRLLLLVPYVLRRPEGVPLGELARELGATAGQVIADIELLSLVGPPSGSPDQFLDLTIEHGKVRARVPPGLARPLRLTTSEAFALLLGLGALRSLGGAGGAPLSAAIDRLAAKIRGVVGGDSAGLVRLEKELSIAGSQPGRDGQGPDGLLTALLGRIEARRSVELVYHSASRGATSRRRVDPYGLLNHGGSWYLVGRCHTHGDVRMFKLERVLALGGSAGDAFAVPGDFDLERFRRDRLTPASEGGEPVRIWLAREALPRAAAAFPRERVCQTTLRGGVELTLDVPPSAWLVGWILALGPNAEALAPAGLRADVVATARAIRRAHGG